MHADTVVDCLSLLHSATSAHNSPNTHIISKLTPFSKVGTKTSSVVKLPSDLHVQFLPLSLFSFSLSFFISFTLQRRHPTNDLEQS